MRSTQTALFPATLSTGCASKAVAHYGLEPLYFEAARRARGGGADRADRAAHARDRFRLIRLTLALLAAAGCADKGAGAGETAAPAVETADSEGSGDSESPPGGTGGPDSASPPDTAPANPYDSQPQDPTLADGVKAPALRSGQEVLLLVNGRASDAASGFTTNRVEESRILGPEVYIYDPIQPGALVSLGRPDLAGFDDPDADAWLRWVVSDVAWLRDAGIYAIGRDPLRGEWILSHWSSPTGVIGADLATAHFAIRPGRDLHHHLYNETDVKALAFVKDTLYAGTVAGYNNNHGGELFAIPFPPELDEDGYYMNQDVLLHVLQLPTNLQYAGDIADTSVGGVAVINANNINVIDPGKNQLLQMNWDEMKFEETSKDIDLSGHNQDVEGLGEVGDVIFGVTVDGLVLRLNRLSGAATLHDDLGPLFRDRDAQIRLRGATRWVIP